MDAEDEKRFIRLLFLCNGDSSIVYKLTKFTPLLEIKKGGSLTAVGAYCLMPNHFHLLLKEVKEGGITRFMRKLLTAYSSYFNKKYERTGSLFGSEFKSEHLNTDEYLKYVFSYIHLNPLKLSNPNWKEEVDKEGAENFLKIYKNSSYLDFIGEEREESCILNKLAFPEYFPSSKSFRDDLLSWFIPISPR